MFSSEVTVVENGRRSELRLPVDMRARYGAGGLPDRVLCHVLEVTRRNARLQIYCDLPRDTIITLKMPWTGTVRARVTWSKDFEAGCRFFEPLKDDDLTIFSTGHA